MWLVVAVVAVIGILLLVWLRPNHQAPDGELAAVINEDLYRVNLQSGQTLPLANNVAHYTPAWSPDGDSVAFTSDRSGAFEVYVTDADGQQLHQISPSGGVTTAWSPDGNWIAFIGNDDSALYIAPSSGGEPRLLVTDVAYPIDPLWSPDGQSILFGSRLGGGPEVYRVTVGDGQIRQITGRQPGQGDELLRRPVGLGPTAGNSYHAWAPDGQRIAFASIQGGPLDIYVADVEGEQAQLLTNGFTPIWSPDGRRIAFMRYQESFNGYTINVMNEDGTNIRELGRLAQHRLQGKLFTWSPDSRWIAFVSSDAVTERQWEDRIWAANVESGTARLVYSGGDSSLLGIAWRPEKR